MFCQRCGTEITEESQRFCHNCGVVLGGTADAESSKKRDFSSKINGFVGGEGRLQLHLRDLVSGVFGHHSPEETERLFLCGLRRRRGGSGRRDRENRYLRIFHQQT